MWCNVGAYSNSGEDLCGKKLTADVMLVWMLGEVGRIGEASLV